MSKKAIIIGAGIVGLATARALAVRGYAVTVIERSTRAVGASIRNFGMIWPIGQPDGDLYETAMSSRSIWERVCNDAGLWYDPVGSLHVAYEQDEVDVLTELCDVYEYRGYKILSGSEAEELSPYINKQQLRLGLYSKNEMIVDPREVIAKIPGWLSEKFHVNFIWGKAVTDIAYPSVFSGEEVYEADEIYVCSGADFETLYPQLFALQPLTKCKLQMMRLAAPSSGERIGPALCGGLSLVHYKSFGAAGSLGQLKNRFEQEYPGYLKWGIHVMAAQNGAGEITIGDSHEYGSTHDPFNKSFINDLILSYLTKLASFPNQHVVDTWHGIYAKLTDGGTHLVLHPEEGVTIINGVGGAGMTLSFGLCDRIIGAKG